jgi:hypothetical protein
VKGVFGLFASRTFIEVQIQLEIEVALHFGVRDPISNFCLATYETRPNDGEATFRVFDDASLVNGRNTNPKSVKRNFGTMMIADDEQWHANTFR